MLAVIKLTTCVPREIHFELSIHDNYKLLNLKLTYTTRNTIDNFILTAFVKVAPSFAINF